MGGINAFGKKFVSIARDFGINALPALGGLAAASMLAPTAGPVALMGAGGLGGAAGLTASSKIREQDFITKQRRARNAYMKQRGAGGGY